MEKNKSGSLSDFLNGLFIGGFLGAAYVYFFHHPQGKKVFKEYWQKREEIWQEIKKELLEEEKKRKSKKVKRESSSSNPISYWSKEIESGMRFFNKKKS